MSPRYPVLFLLCALAACGDPGTQRTDGGGLPDALADGLAPPDIRPDAPLAPDGATPVDGDVVFRVDTQPGEHVAFDLRFPVGTAGVLLHVDRWDGSEPVPLEVTDGGAGIRVLAVVDQGGPRTFWVRITADEPLTGSTLTITRTPFTEGNVCDADCAHLLQLPIPNDPATDGYLITGATFRYQFGRRDLVMFIRAAGRRVVAADMMPFRLEDLSQWDGETPGADVGALRHASHQRGKDVDISLYGEDGAAPFRSYCTTTNTGDGRVCIGGSLDGYDGHASALLIGSFYASGRVTMCFLDQELITPTIAGAEAAEAAGELDAALVPLYADGVHLQHWPNHDNHVHVRVSEVEGATLVPEPFAAP